MFRGKIKFACIGSVLFVLLAWGAASAVMPPMEQIGPQSRPVLGYAHVVQVSPGEGNVAKALASINDASAQKRYAVLFAAGTYNESNIQMKPYVDMYGGFAGGDFKARDVYENATTIDGQKNGPVVIGADNARLDGFVITGGERNGMGAGIMCDGVSPTIVNNIIVANHTLKFALGEGLGKQIANEGAGIALLNGSNASVANNLIAENSTGTGAGAGITVRGNVNAKILRNVFCNNTSGLEDNTQFHGKEGSRSSPGAAVAVQDASSPQISFNVMVMGTALYKNDAGGIWVEGNSMPLISYNWIAGNTAYDDGGGIYCMGNLYFDEAGERHDYSPDASVPIEDNLIAGNNAVTGGPGGVRVSRWGRVDLRRNRIVGNVKGGAYGAEGGAISVNENNTIEDNETGNPRFQLTGDITGRKFDAARYVTEITTGKQLGDEDVTGAAIRIGEQWSIVKSTAPGSVTVWGKVTDEAATFEVLDHYGMKNIPRKD